MALLDVTGLTVEFPTRRGTLRALDGISFEIAPGEILGVVGESGAGKSLTGAAIIGLLEPPGRVADGQIVFDGKRIDRLTSEKMRPIRGRQIGAIFQDPLTTLNPLISVGRQLTETMQTHLKLSDRDARARAVKWLEDVGIPAAADRLMGSIPALDVRVERLRQIDGSMPRLGAIPRGCAFNPRCPKAVDICRLDRPDLMPAGATMAACWAIEVSRHFDVSRPALQRMMSGESRRILRAVDGISFDITAGTTLSLVGESGCGKSTVARLAVGLYAPTDGEIRFEGHSLSAARAQPDLRRKMNMIFQDPYASLNPRWRVRDIVAEPIRAFKILQGGPTIAARVGQLLTQVDIFRAPRHPYTRLLLDAIPDVAMVGRSRTPVSGEVPSPITPPSGCTFHPRCPLANDRCRVEKPMQTRLAVGQIDNSLHVGSFSNMKATSLLDERHQLDPVAVVALRIWQVPARVRGSAHAYKYALAYIVDGICVLRYDNEAGKGDHRHIGEREALYRFTTPADLLADFWHDVTRRALAAFKGERQDARISFASVDLLWDTLTRKRWEILHAMTGQGEIHQGGARRRHRPFEGRRY
eukprot:gene10833-10913_t